MNKAPIIHLSRSAEDYLEAVGELCELNGQAQVSDLAERLQVKKPSVTAAMRHLADLGLVEYSPYNPIQLTESGRRYAANVMRAHHILQDFIQAAAGLAPSRAEEVACYLEHMLTPEEVEFIEQRLKSGFFEHPTP